MDLYHVVACRWDGVVERSGPCDSADAAWETARLIWSDYATVQVIAEAPVEAPIEDGGPECDAADMDR